MSMQSAPRTFTVVAGSPEAAVALVRAQSGLRPWRQARVMGAGGVSGVSAQTGDLCFGTTPILLTAFGALAVGLVGGWWLATMMQVGTAVAPVAAAGLKGATVAALL